MPRFVILTHDHPFPHWDLMLEQAGSLRTWRLLREPDAPGPIVAEPLPDHRLEYLDYEGPVSRNRGTVCRWDAGDYVFVNEPPGLPSGRIVVRLTGERLHGTAALGSDRSAEQGTFHFTSD